MPKKLTKEELEERIRNIDSSYVLVDYSKYQNNRSIIELKHSCGRKINTTFKAFQECKITCSCEKRTEKRKQKLQEYLKNRTNGRGQYLIKENYLEDLFRTEPDYQLISGEYKGNNKEKIKILHKTCNFEFETTINRFQQGQRCPRCADLIRVGALPSLGSFRIHDYLNENKLFQTKEKKFDDCKDQSQMPFDFEDIYDNLIEFDGEQHFNKWKRGYETAQKHDKMKNNYCIKNNKTLLRIPYTSQDKVNEILDAFYKKDYNTLIEYDVLLISPDVRIKTKTYYTEKQCRSKTV